MKFPFLMTLLNKVRLKTIKAYSVYIDSKFENTDVCTVWPVDKNNIAFESPLTKGVVPYNDFTCHVIRKMIGQNILSVVGPPKDKNIPTVLLLPMPALLLQLGPKLFFQFIKDWKGTSYIGEVPVVQYLFNPLEHK